MAVIREGQMTSKGARGVSADRHVVDMQKKVYMYDAGSNPALRALTARSQTIPVKSFEPKWLEDEPVPEWEVTTASALVGATTIPVSNGRAHKAGDVIGVPRTGEYMLVQSVAADNLTVARGAAGSTAAALNNAENIINLGLYDTEGNRSPVAKSTITSTKSNFTRTLKTPVELSRTLSQVELYGGNERPRLRVNAAQKHARLLELEFFHGIKYEDLSGNEPRRYAGGLDHFVTSNVLNASGPVSESELYEWLGTVYRHGVDGATSTSRVLFCGQVLMNTISMWGQAKLQTDSKRNARYGFHIRTLLTPYGELDIVYHPLLENEYAGDGYVVDMSGIKIAQLQPTILETNVQETDRDGFKDQYLSEQTYIIINEKAHGRIRGAQ